MTFRESDIEHRGIQVHLWEGGQGFPLLLLHGSGPGASALGIFGRVLDSLAEHYHVLAADLIGFGRSGRKSKAPYFDLDLWTSQVMRLVDSLPSGPVGIVGHSLSGSLALKAALANERIHAVMTTGTLGAPFKLNGHLDRAWSFPRDRTEVRRISESLVFDQSMITESLLDGRMQVLSSPGYEAYFTEMFSGDKQRYIDDAVIAQKDIARLRCRVLLMHGKEDVLVPFEATSLPISRALPVADLIALSRCRHSPPLERPEMFLAAARAFFG